MQHLYMLNRDKDLSQKECLNSYSKTLDRLYDLYMYSIYTLVSIAKMAQKDEAKRLSKYIKKDEDKKFSSKLYSNDLVNSLIDNAFFQKHCDDRDYESLVDEDLLNGIYKSFAKKQIYKDYINTDSSNHEHLEMILELFRYCRRNEHYNDLMEDFSSIWLDDKSLVVGVVKKTIKDLPLVDDAFSKHYPDKETAMDYGHRLLELTIENDSTLNGHVEPVINNWDIDRLALVDLLFIKMACSEFLYFPSIPTKVTLNEYVDLAKVYSTEKSKDFINGVMDKVMKSLETQELIQKEGRGLVC